ncbi:MAG: hypothetical protein BWY32_03780 [bacterium ADurb.Bin243]|jgi:hypothetical protein|nr:MAG: hypothetical protein BWY32_03780 [bacterium ADurb.Bin243]
MLKKYEVTANGKTYYFENESSAKYFANELNVDVIVRDSKGNFKKIIKMHK